MGGGLIKDAMGGGEAGGLLGGASGGGSSNGSINVGDISINFPPLPKANNSPITSNTPSPYESIIQAPPGVNKPIVFVP